MAGGLFWTTTGGTITSLTPATATTLLGAKAGASFSLYAKRWRVSFPGTTASNVPVLIEFCYATFGANPPGTASSSVTPVQQSGRVTTAGFTAGKLWTTEPTTLTVLEELTLSPNGGVYSYDEPLQDEPDTALGEGFAIRVTAPNSVGARLSMLLGRC